MKTGSNGGRIALIVWTTLVCSGFFSLFSYASKPGNLSRSTGWPPQTRLQRNTTGPTLVVFIHPACPCTRATLENLCRALPEQQGFALHLVCLEPPSEMQWESLACAALIDRLSSQHDAQVFIDPADDSESKRFAAATSGQCMLFSSDGEMTFSGGVTASRGHIGSNAGLATLIRQLESPETNTEIFPVFGCSL